MRFVQVWREARIAAVRDVTPTIREIEIAPLEGAPSAYAPGAHVCVGVEIGGRPDTRSYSLVGLPGGPTYRIAVKQVAASRGGSAYMRALAPGARVSITEPQALFALDFGRPETLLVAGGIGVTPIVGMAELLAQRGDPLRMIYTVRHRADLAYVDRLAAALGDRLSLAVTGEGVRPDLAAALAALPEGGLVAACGPLAMMDDIRRIWRDLRRPIGDLRFETFGSGGRFPPEPFTVRVVGLDRVVPVPADRSMLDALAEAGVEVMSDCRRGECGLCAVDVLSVAGEIDHRDVFFGEHEKVAGHKICACVSRARGEITVDVGYRPDMG